MTTNTDKLKKEIGYLRIQKSNINYEINIRLKQIEENENIHK